MMSLSIEIRPLEGPPSAGVDALVRAIAALAGTSYDEAAVLSGAAFRTYYLTPDDNHAYREVISDREWSWGSLDIENYGVLESLSVHLDRDLRVWALPTPRDLAAVARVELEAGRPLLARFGREPTEVGVLTAIEVAGRRFEVTPPAGAGDAREMRSETLTAWADSAARPIDLVTVKPGVEEHTARRREVLRRDVLRFAGAHARSRKELSYSEELFYASGLRAWEIAAESLVARWRSEDAVAFAAFWGAWTSACRSARSAAAKTLDRWAGPNPDFADAARAYAEVADAIPVASHPMDWSDANTRKLVAGAIEDARLRDISALDALRRAVENLPPLE